MYDFRKTVKENSLLTCKRKYHQEEITILFSVFKANDNGYMQTVYIDFQSIKKPSHSKLALSLTGFLKKEIANKQLTKRLTVTGICRPDRPKGISRRSWRWGTCNWPSLVIVEVCVLTNRELLLLEGYSRSAWINGSNGSYRTIGKIAAQIHAIFFLIVEPNQICQIWYEPRTFGVVPPRQTSKSRGQPEVRDENEESAIVPLVYNKLRL